MFVAKKIKLGEANINPRIKTKNIPKTIAMNTITVTVLNKTQQRYWKKPINKSRIITLNPPCGKPRKHIRHKYK